MLGRLAMWVLLGVAASACDAPQRADPPAPPKARETPVAAPVSKQQADPSLVRQPFAVVSTCSDRKQALEEFTVALERDTKILG